MRVLSIISFAVALVATTGTVAFAQSVYNYTLNVPVSVTNAPNGGWAQVSCFLQSGPNGGGNQVGEGDSPREVLANGSFSGTVAIKVSSSTKPRSYGCVLLVVNNSQMLNITDLTYNSPPVNGGWTGTPAAVGNLP